MNWLKLVFLIMTKTSIKKTKDIPLVVTYRLIPQGFNNIIKSSLKWLYDDTEVDNPFSPRPVVSF